MFPAGNTSSTPRSGRAAGAAFRSVGGAGSAAGVAGEMGVAVAAGETGVAGDRGVAVGDVGVVVAAEAGRGELLTGVITPGSGVVREEPAPRSPGAAAAATARMAAATEVGRTVAGDFFGRSLSR
jgi:hypothetical protein